MTNSASSSTPPFDPNKPSVSVPSMLPKVPQHPSSPVAPPPTNTVGNTAAAASNVVSRSAIFTPIPATTVSKPQFLRDGNILYNGRKYKVTLFVGSTELSPEAKQEAWKETAMKIVKSLDNTSLLPKDEVKAVTIDYTNRAITQEKEDNTEEQVTDTSKVGQVIDYTEMSSPTAPSATSTPKLIKQEIEEYHTGYHLPHAKKLEAEKKVETDKAAADADKLDGEIRGTHNQFTFKFKPEDEDEQSPGRIACTPVAVEAALAIANKQMSNPQVIEDALNNGTTVFYDVLNAEETEKNEIIAPHFLNATDVAQKADRVKNKVDQTLITNIDPTTTKHINYSLTDPNDNPPTVDIERKSYFVTRFSEFVNQIAKKVQIGKTLAGVITLQGYSYAIALTKDAKKDEITKIEFFDSHGRPLKSTGKPSAAYYIPFTGESGKPAIQKFTDFFSSLVGDGIRHNYYTEGLSPEVKKEALVGHLVNNGTLTAAEATGSDQTKVDREIRNITPAKEKQILAEMTGETVSQNLISFTPIMPPTPASTPIVSGGVHVAGRTIAQPTNTNTRAIPPASPSIPRAPNTSSNPVDQIPSDPDEDNG